MGPTRPLASTPTSSPCSPSTHPCCVPPPTAVRPAQETCCTPLPAGPPEAPPAAATGAQLAASACPVILPGQRGWHSPPRTPARRRPPPGSRALRRTPAVPRSAARDAPRTAPPSLTHSLTTDALAGMAGALPSLCWFHLVHHGCHLAGG